MDAITSVMLRDLRAKRKHCADEDEHAFIEETTPFIGVDDSDALIPYADEEGLTTPVRCAFDQSVRTESEVRNNQGSSKILFSSIQRKLNNLEDDTDGFALLQALAENNIDQLNRWVSWHLSRSTLDKLRYGSNRETALIIASSGCDLKIINALLDAGVDPNEADWSGRNPLLVAAAYKRPECMKAILEKGAKPNLGFKKLDGLRASEALEDIEWSRKEDEYLNKQGIKLPTVKSDGFTPLHSAAQVNSLDCLNLLLEFKADSNAKDCRGVTPLMLAGEGLDAGNIMAVRTYEGIIEALMTHGARVEGIGEKKMKTTVLHRAAELDAPNALGLLLKKGCDPNWCVSELNQLMPLHVAAETAAKSCQPNPSCISTLLSYGADLSAENGEGVSALEIIVSQVSRPKKFLLAVLDSQINLTQEECEAGGEVSVNFKSVCPVNDDHQEKVLYALLVEECICRWMRYDLFRHPLLKSFVIRKWSRLKRFFYVYVVVYLIHVLSLSVFVTLAHCDIFGSGWRNSIVHRGIPFSKLLVIVTSVLVLINISWMCYVFPNRYPISFETLRNVGGSVLSIIISILTVYDGDSYAFSNRLSMNNLDNREEMEPHYSSNEVTVLEDASILKVNYSGEIPIFPNTEENTQTMWTESHEVQWVVIHCTALAIFQAWLDLMLLMGRFPWASDALLFTAVLKNVLRVLATYGYMIIGFAFVFFLEFREANVYAFGDPWKALLKTMVMVMGEYDYMDTFVEENKGSTVLVESKLPIYSQAIFLGFIVIASIALMNLMLGLAVSDTQELAEESSQRQMMKLAESVVHWGTAACALEKLFYRYSKIKDLFQRSRIISNELRFPLNFKKTVIPRELMKESLEIAMKNHEQKQNQEKDRKPFKKSTAPRKIVSYVSNGSVSPKTAEFIPQYPATSENAKEVIESLRNEIAELKELRQEVAEIKELMENYFNGERGRRPIPRTYQGESTRNTSRYGAFFQRSSRNRSIHNAKLNVQHI